MSTECTYLFAISFLLGSESGLAIVSARNAAQARTVLKNQGKYNGTPERYQIEVTKNIGLYTQEQCTLILESYTNALVAFDAILAAIGNLYTYDSVVEALGYVPANQGDLVQNYYTKGYIDDVIAQILSSISGLITEEEFAEAISHTQSVNSGSSFPDNPKEGDIFIIQPHSIEINNIYNIVPEQVYEYFNGAWALRSGKGLSTNDFTDELKYKLENLVTVEYDAELETIEFSANSDVTYDTETETIEIYNI